MTTESSQPETPVLSNQELNERLVALRTALEDLAQGLGEEGPQASSLAQALQCLAGVDKSAQAFWEYAFPKPLRVDRLALGPLVDHCLGGLKPEHRRRLLVELEDRDGKVWLDGSLFAERLQQLLTSALDGQTGSVFMRSHGGNSRHLTLVWTHPPSSEDPFQATIPFQLALRDLQRMGIFISQPELPGSQACCVLRFDAEQPGEVSPGDMSAGEMRTGEMNPGENL